MATLIWSSISHILSFFLQLIRWRTLHKQEKCLVLWAWSKFYSKIQKSCGIFIYSSCSAFYLSHCWHSISYKQVEFVVLYLFRQYFKRLVQPCKFLYKSGTETCKLLVLGLMWKPSMKWHLHFKNRPTRFKKTNSCTPCSVVFSTFIF